MTNLQYCGAGAVISYQRFKEECCTDKRKRFIMALHTSKH